MYDWRWLCVGLGAVLLTSTPGRASFWTDIQIAKDIISDLTRTQSEEEAQSVPWCPIAEHPKRVFRSPSGTFCYATYTVQLTWKEAAEFCSQKGGALARLHGGEKIRAEYYTMFGQMHNDCAWIGLSKQNDHWQWVDGSPMRREFSRHELQVISRWFSCGSLCKYIHGNFAFSHEYELSRKLCSSKYDFFCEYELSSNETEEALGKATTDAVSSKPDIATLKQPSISFQDVYEPFSDGATPYVHGPISTMEVTTPASGTATRSGSVSTVYKPVTYKRRRPGRKTKAKSPVIKKLSTGTVLTGQSLFNVHVYGVTMCARHCFKLLPMCKVFNFSPVTKQCSGFGSFDNLQTESRKGWEVWQTK